MGCNRRLLPEDIRMIRALLPYLLTAIVAVILRDVECFVAAKIFCWRKRRQTQRQVKQELAQRERELQEQSSRTAAAKLAVAASTIPFPDLLNGPLVIEADSMQEVTLTIREVVANLRWQRKRVCPWDQNVEN
jgi:hypothetical protein